MKLQRLYSLTRKAIDDYQMIEEGDKIAIGISGGKDSLTLLYALSGLRRFYPKKFDIEAIAVNLGFKEGMDYTRIKELCDQLDVPFHVVDTEIAEIIFEARKEENPCSLCAKMRKGTFNEKAVELGCNKLAYAHHKDDVIETMMMSLIFEGHFYTFAPITYLDRMNLTLIRPLIYIDECDVRGFMKAYDLPVQKNPCPADGYTKREYAKNLLKQLESEHPGTRQRFFHSITVGTLPNWKKEDPKWRTDRTMNNKPSITT